MIDFLGKLLYPLFGALVLTGYVYCARSGFEPFEPDNETHTISSAAGGGSVSGGGYYRSPSVFRYGGFGGK